MKGDPEPLGGMRKGAVIMLVAGSAALARTIIFAAASLGFFLLAFLWAGSLEWFLDEPKRGQTFLTCITIIIAVSGIWVGRNRPSLAGLAVLIFVLFAGVTIPSAMPARPLAYKHSCIANLKAIQNAKVEWARETQQQPAAIAMEKDLYGTNKVLRHFPACPMGGKYRIGAINEDPTCPFAKKGHKI
jgi:hypothetical protein